MDVDLNRKCGRALMELRREAGLTQTELAARLSLPQSFVSKIETGERALRAYEVFAYAAGLGIDGKTLIEALEQVLT